MNLFNRLPIASALAAAVALGVVPAPTIAVVPEPSSASELARSAIVPTATRTGSSAHAELLGFLLAPVADPAQFEGKRIAIVASDGASAFELETTRDYFMDRGARVHILAPRPVEGAPMVGLAGFVPPSDLLTTVDYAGTRRLVATTWYLDQVNPQDYDAIYVPNNLEDIERLGANGQTMRFLIAAQAARCPMFVTGNARAIVSGLAIPSAAQTRQSVYGGQDAFDMPQLIGALAATLAAAPKREIN
jgi:hypothetical protein